VLVERLLEDKQLNKNHVVTTEAIVMDQVYLIILIMCCGMITAFVIFIIEKVVYAYNKHKS